jgi:hypothetical protein
VLALGMAGAAHGAGGHYGVDDASIVDAGRCQLESWYARADAGHYDYTLLPACNPGGRLELTLGLSRLRDPAGRDSVLELGAKTLFRQIERGSYGWGLALSTTWGGALERHEGAIAYVPLSVSVADDTLLHYNFGWAYERHADDAMIWGIGGDVSLSRGFNLIAEAYGTHRGGTELQGGLRYSFSHALIDLSYGRSRSERRDDWITLGLGWGF